MVAGLVVALAESVERAIDCVAPIGQIGVQVERKLAPRSDSCGSDWHGAFLWKVAEWRKCGVP